MINNSLNPVCPVPAAIPNKSTIKNQSSALAEGLRNVCNSVTEEEFLNNCYGTVDAILNDCDYLTDSGSEVVLFSRASESQIKALYYLALAMNARTFPHYSQAQLQRTENAISTASLAAVLDGIKRMLSRKFNEHEISQVFKIVTNWKIDGYRISTCFAELVSTTSAEASELFERERETAALMIQKTYRGYRARKPEDNTSDIRTARDCHGIVNGYYLNGHFVRKPPKLPVKAKVAGSYKILTHREELNFSPLSNSKRVVNLVPQVGLTLKYPENYRSLAPAVLAEVNAKPHIIPQIRVSRDLVISENLGAADLEMELDGNSGYQFNLEQFKPLARELDDLHRKNIVHRDIKPENMFVRNGEVYLTDLDGMGKIGSFNVFSGSEYYTHKNFINMWISDSCKFYNKYALAVNADKYAFLMSVMDANYQTKVGTLSSANYRQIVREFTNTNIKPQYRDAVINFLHNPDKYSIPALAELFL